MELVPQALIVRHSHPLDFHNPQTNYYTTPAPPRLSSTLGVSGKPQAFPFQDDVLFILSPDSTSLFCYFCIVSPSALTEDLMEGR